MFEFDLDDCDGIAAEIEDERVGLAMEISDALSRLERDPGGKDMPRGEPFREVLVRFPLISDAIQAGLILCFSSTYKRGR